METGFTRRNFLSTTGAGLAGMALASPINSLLSLSGDKGRKISGKGGNKVRVALVGTGSRGCATWGERLIHPYKKYVEMAGICDINHKRLEVAKKLIRTNAPAYHSSEFDRMVKETKPDLVIITTPDCYHASYAVRAMKLGCDVLVEKPLATEADQCQAILDAEKRTGRTVWVAFNARHGAGTMEIKRILDSGELGKLISAEFHEFLDIDHGAAYFRRWHGKKEFSGSLLVHKASHHFDQLNWWLEAEPVEVNAYGKVAFYGSNNSFRGTKCRGCPFRDRCDFYWDITQNERYMQLYVACEDVDRYYRDSCVWANDISTYDTQTVEVVYNNGVLLSYTLNAYMPYEGQRIAFNGRKGRLDAQNFQRQSWDVPYSTEIRVSKNFKDSELKLLGGRGGVDTGAGKSGHGGSDGRLKDILFVPEMPDSMNQIAGSRAGVASSLIGIAAVRSIETGKPVRIEDLIDYPTSWGFWNTAS